MIKDYRPGERLSTADPASAGMDGEKLGGLDKEVRSRYGNINGLLVLRKGSIVFEEYYNGFGPGDPHHVASVTKSFISALIGIAIDAGFIQSVDQKVLDFFPEYTVDEDDFRKRAVTLRHLLTMTAPVALHAGDGRGAEPLDRLRRQRDWVMYILKMLGQNGSPGQFRYSTAGSHLLSAVLTRTTGTCAREFANERLFRPIGSAEIPDNPGQGFGLDEVFGKNLKGWVHDPQGNTAGGWGLAITPRDMARFGYLYLMGGMWGDARVIPKSWIEESTALNDNNYGYLWWLRNEGGVFSYSALGSGGNGITCVPEKDLVVVIASGIIQKPRDRWPLLENYILPAVND